MTQRLLITTPKHRVEVNLTATPEKFGRLLFPHQDAIFSDFEVS